MKYLLLIVLALAGWWIWRRSRQSGSGRTRIAEAPPEQAMGRCAHCGVYCPLDDMLTDGQGRTYCGAAHRSAGPSEAGGRR